MRTNLIMTVLLLACCASTFCQDSLWVVDTRHNSGYIDINGKYIIPLKYKSASKFHEGLACVEDSLGNAFINTKGDIVFRSDNFTVFHEGLGYIKKNCAINFIDKKGNIAIKPIYEPYTVGCCGSCGAYFSEGLAPVVLSISENHNWYRYIFINKQGKRVFDQTFLQAANFSQGLAYVRYEDSTCGYINKSGKKVIKLNPRQYGEMFSEGYALIYNEDYSCYFIDQTGKKLGTYTFRNAESFSDGLAKVNFTERWPYKWGFINLKGEMVIQPQYNEATSFSDSLSSVTNYATPFVPNSPSLTYIIDTKGKIKLGPYERTTINEFKNGLAPGTKILNDTCHLYFYINKKGVFVWKGISCRTYGPNDF